MQPPELELREREKERNKNKIECLVENWRQKIEIYLQREKENGQVRGNREEWIRNR